MRIGSRTGSTAQDALKVAVCPQVIAGTRILSDPGPDSIPIVLLCRYNRLLRRCQAAVVTVGQRLGQLLDAPTCAFEALDSLGVPTRNAKRRGRGWLAGQAGTGWCGRLGWFHGVHLLLAVTPVGAVTGYGVTRTTVRDQARADIFLAVRHSPEPALPDTGFEGQIWQAVRCPAWWYTAAIPTSSVVALTWPRSVAGKRP